jgi:hypothetical protein
VETETEFVSMTLPVVAYPELGDTERAWIESIRSRHDPQANRLGVHFTLVFPTLIPAGQIECRRVRGVLRSIEVINVAHPRVESLEAFVLG